MNEQRNCHLSNRFIQKYQFVLLYKSFTLVAYWRKKNKVQVSLKTISDEGHGNLWTEKGKEKVGQEIGGNIMNLSEVWETFVQIGFCWHLFKQILGGSLNECLDGAHFIV